MPASTRTTKTVIFDLDGVLADPAARQPLAQAGLIDEFYSLVLHDDPIPLGVSLARWARTEGYKVRVLTGRPESCRWDTLEWLRRNVFDGDLCSCDLLMRPSFDVPYEGFKTSVLKPIKDGIAFAVDDDPSVVEEMKALGLSVIHLNIAGMDHVTWWQQTYGSKPALTASTTEG